MKQSQPLRRGRGLSPTGMAVLASPLDFISEDHLRARQICVVIDRLAAVVSFDRGAARTVLRFLNEELNLHMRDEADDLFPLMTRRCPVEDGIDGVIARIRSDLDAAAQLMPAMRATLACCLEAGTDLSADDRRVLTRFCGHMRHHLAAENAILLPIARLRLTKRDLQTLSRHMRRRRGMPPDTMMQDHR